MKLIKKIFAYICIIYVSLIIFCILANITSNIGVKKLKSSVTYGVGHTSSFSKSKPKKTDPFKISWVEYDKKRIKYFNRKQ